MILFQGGILWFLVCLIALLVSPTYRLRSLLQTCMKTKRISGRLGQTLLLQRVWGFPSRPDVCTQLLLLKTDEIINTNPLCAGGWSSGCSHI